MKRESRAPDGVLLASFAAVILSFAGATWYSQYRAEAIDSAAGTIALHAAPGIRHVAEARTEVRRLQALAADALAAAPEERGARVHALEESGESLEAELAAYRGVAASPGERALWQAATPDVAALTASRREVGQALREERLQDARRLASSALRMAAERANASLLQIIDFDARQAQALALGIERVRERSSRIAWGLDLLCGVFSAVAGVLVWRSMRRHARLTAALLRLTQGRAEELELFAGRVAHDILNPIGAAALAVDLGRRYAAGNASAEAALVRARMSLTGTSRIVNGLLEFARAGARPVPGSRAQVEQVVDELTLELKPAAAEVGAELRVEPFAPCAVACSPGCLASLVSNLVRNAIKYIGDAPLRRIAVRVSARDGCVRVEVEDTGPGLPPGLGLSCFEPYVRGDTSGKPGIGLGLATVKRIAEAHGGAVGVHSWPGQGCCFWFQLPVSGEHARRAPSPTAAERRLPVH
jgi:signal transduction histidine kinase